MGRVSSPNEAVRGAVLGRSAPRTLTIIEVTDDAPCSKASASPRLVSAPAGEVLVTWMKTRPELVQEMAADDLSETACLAHIQGLAWLYAIEHDDCLIPRRLLASVLPLTADPITAVAELCAARYWAEEGKSFRVVHDAGTVRQSLAAQWAKRDKDARGKAAAKAKRESEASAPASMPQPNNLTTELPAVREGSHLRPVGQCRTCNYGDPPTPNGRCQHCVDWDVKEIAS